MAAHSEEDPAPGVTSHTTRPDRVVLTEDGNPDGWLASDTVVTVEP